MKGPTSYSFYILILSLVLASTVTSHYHECPHDKLPTKKFLIRTHLEGSTDKATKNVGGDDGFNQPIRINIHYNFSIFGVLTEDKQEQVKTIMGQVKENLESILTVRRTPSPLRLRRACDGDNPFILTGPTEPCFNRCSNNSAICSFFPVPSDHLQRCVECNGDRSNCVEAYSDGPGLEDTDLALYVYGVSLFCGASTIAYASSCQLEDQYDRPIAGIINFCPSNIDDDEEVFQVAKHEIFHVLGFSSSLYPWYRDENGNPRTRRDANGNPPTDANGDYVADESTVKMVNLTDWQTRFGPTNKTVTQLVTPKVVEVGRRHFNCNTLEGVQLEDQGGGGTAGSHWEKRLLNYEAMTGVISQNIAFSNFSYALLEDSGWYKVDYSNASILVWGRGDGCGYTAGSCGGYIDTKKRQNQPIAPFCNFFNDEFNPQNLSCNIDRTAVAFCNLVDNYYYYLDVSIPPEYQYFNSGANFNSSAFRLPFYGGIVHTADFCPFYFDLPFRQALEGICRKGIPLTDSNEAAETYGPRSRCVDHSGKWQITNGSNTYTAQYSAGCYEYQCSNSVVTIMIFGQSYTCSRAGQVIQVDQTADGVRYRGGIVCPSCVEICYDDFENCPEAAELYGEFASPAPPTDSVGSLLPMVGLLFVAIFASFAVNY
ncbi:PREDICTED: leishmanolysin-like peptidase [Amphimedon queenslandica]|uniref:Leishmanolysin-like peptidase n=1 Tax=Amphimedon queenslandica TaxID=400682 RepID=A0A1X7V214_AMPQE|nr:PREDICTED: leishmanolysin-like peptidase [Amphimedon queenslandica]|eukprot:XP_019850941.1 PREDICTED: leishmanolysin-like peptidase [Amphimedon queenslandica]